MVSVSREGHPITSSAYNVFIGIRVSTWKWLRWQSLGVSYETILLNLRWSSTIVSYNIHTYAFYSSPYTYTIQLSEKKCQHTR